MASDHRDELLRRLPKDGRGAEIGVFRGDFSARILEIVQPRALFLVDPWVSVADEGRAGAWYHASSGTDMDAVYAGVRERFAEEIGAGRVTLLRAPSGEAASAIPDGSLDFVYVDGDHTRDAALADLEIALRKTRAGGFIGVDDNAAGDWFGDGVMLAVHTFLGRHPDRLRIAWADGDQLLLTTR